MRSLFFDTIGLIENVCILLVFVTYICVTDLLRIIDCFKNRTKWTNEFIFSVNRWRADFKNLLTKSELKTLKAII
jgi:hypothetical protein